MVDAKTRNFMMHVLRNPSGWSDEVIREMRLKACTELDRLWNMEVSIACFIDDMKDRLNK